MSVEVDIYMSNIIKFFKENPKNLLSLVSKDDEEQFYNKIREVALKNIEKGLDVQLTKTQLIDICREISMKKLPKYLNSAFMSTKFGDISLN